MTITAIFKSPLPSFTYVFKDGMTATFLNGRYLTSDERLIKELAAEIGAVGRTKTRHPYIFIDEDEYEIDSDAMTPIELIKLQAKEEARRELLAEQAAERARAMDAAGNISKSESSNFTNSMNNTASIAAAAMESTGDMAAKLTVPASSAQPISTTPPGTATITPVTTPPATSMGAKLANLTKGT